MILIQQTHWPLVAPGAPFPSLPVGRGPFLPTTATCGRPRISGSRWWCAVITHRHGAHRRRSLRG